MSMNDNELQCYRGSESNELNVVLYNDDDGDAESVEIPNIGHSAYIETNELSRYLEDHKKITILSLNIQSINAKI